MLRTQPLQFGVTGLYCLEVNLTPEREMVEVVFQFKLFEFEKA